MPDDEDKKKIVPFPGGQSKSDDFLSKFGRQLKSKGTAGAAESFFFVEDDPRLGESLDFFFGEDRLDLDRIREEYQERRPQLAAILKKKARSKAKLSETKKRKTSSGKMAIGRSARHKPHNFKKNKFRTRP